MKLLIVTPEFLSSGGGIATYYRELAAGLTHHGVETTVIEGSAFVHGNTEAKVIDGVTVHKLSSTRFQQQRERFDHLASVPRLADHLAASWAVAEQMDFGRSFDVIEATDWGLLFAPFVIAGSVPTNVQCHASIGQISVHDPMAEDELASALVKSLESQLFSRCQSLQTLSQANADFWKRETGRSVSVQYPAFAPQDSLYDELSSDGLVVGRFQRWKGPDVLAEALRRMGDEAPIVNWVGRDLPWGSTQRMTSAHIKKNYPSVFGKSIKLFGTISPTEVRRRQANAKFNLVPSTWDVFNFTAVEALDSGRPTIVSRGAGASELIDDGRNGFLFDPNDPDSLLSALRRVQELSANECASIGAAAAATVREKLDPIMVGQQRLTHYRRLTQNPVMLSGWAAEIATPRDTFGETKDLRFLDDFSLKRILSYLQKRVARRLLGRLKR